MAPLVLLYLTDLARDVDLTERYFEDVEDVDLVAATDVESAMSCLKAAPVDCVVSDHRPPAIDGLDVFDRTRAIDPEVPFILFPSLGSEALAADAIDRRVTAYIPRDITFAEYDLLEQRVRQAVEKVETERALEATRARFRALTENADFAVLTIDDDSVVRYANEGVRTVFGYDPDELEGESLLQLVPDRLRDDHQAGIERYLGTGEPCLDWSWIELPGLHRDGHEVALGLTFGVATVDGEPLFTGIARRRSGARATADAEDAARSAESGE